MTSPDGIPSGNQAAMLSPTSRPNAAPENRKQKCKIRYMHTQKAHSTIPLKTKILRRWKIVCGRVTKMQKWGVPSAENSELWKGPPAKPAIGWNSFECFVHHQKLISHRKTDRCIHLDEPTKPHESELTVQSTSPQNTLLPLLKTAQLQASVRLEWYLDNPTDCLPRNDCTQPPISYAHLSVRGWWAADSASLISPFLFIQLHFFQSSSNTKWWVS